MNKEDICIMSACDMAEKIRSQELTSTSRYFEDIAPWHDKKPKFT